MPLHFSNTYLELPPRCYSQARAGRVQKPVLLALNLELADELGLEPEELTAAGKDTLTQIFSGNELPEGAASIALAYAGHQFGGFSPQLGDGRAILLGEVVGKSGRRLDVQLKGAGRTAYSRGGDGRAALGPVLREYLVSEAMVALGVPTTRSLAAVSSGELVQRTRPLPGAVLTRVAASHLRIGTFQYFAARGETETLAQLVRYALTRHFPDALGAENPALKLLEYVMSAQAELVARWLALGFVHGVMNTDNMSISGETLDYGPCAFLDVYAPDRVFSSIDERGRYSFRKQPNIARWNLYRLADTLIPLVDADSERAIAQLMELLETFDARFERAFETQFRRKLGLLTEQTGDVALAEQLLSLMAAAQADFSNTFRSLEELLSDNDARFVEHFKETSAANDWISRWRERVAIDGQSQAATKACLQGANPVYIPRNQQIERMIADAEVGNMDTFHRAQRILSQPYTEQAGAEDWAQPPAAEDWDYHTFCGT
jgi:uncharacterized protein YdiU (UPF0061 family)